jgi:hypothetical protein
MTIEAVTIYLHDMSKSSEILEPDEKLNVYKSGVSERELVVVDEKTILLQQIDDEKVIATETLSGEEINDANIGFTPHEGFYNILGTVIYTAGSQSTS